MTNPKAVMRCLIVDDEPVQLRSTSRVLKQAAPELELSTAEGARAGLEKARSLRPDLVLVDMYMPEMTGVEFCVELLSKPETAKVLVVALTGEPGKATEAFLRAGALGVLAKPLVAAELLQLIGLGRDEEIPPSQREQAPARKGQA